jgi:hypothetical protein
MQPDLSKKGNTPLPPPATPPPRPPGITTSPSSRRTPRPTPSPPSSAHQSLQLSHHFPACHGCQPRTPATYMPHQNNRTCTICLQQHHPQFMQQPPAQPPNRSGPTSPPHKPSVDGAHSPPRSSAIETFGANPSVPSATPVPPQTTCPPSGTTSGHALLRMKPKAQAPPHATPHTAVLTQIHQQLLGLKTQQFH